MNLITVPAPSGNLCVGDNEGNGLPLLFIHSLAGNHKQWKDQLSYFQHSHRIIAVNLRGHGESSLPEDEDFSISAHMKDVICAVHHLKLSRFVLVGHSFGATVSIAVAKSLKEQVQGLFLLDPVGDIRQYPVEETQSFLEALESDCHYSEAIQNYWRQILKGSQGNVTAQVMEDLLKTSKEAVIGGFRALLSYDSVTALESFLGPKFCMVSDLGDTPLSLHRLIPGLNFQKLRSTGHWLQMDKPAEINSYLEKFISAI